MPDGTRIPHYSLYDKPACGKRIFPAPVTRGFKLARQARQVNCPDCRRIIRRAVGLEAGRGTYLEAADIFEERQVKLTPASCANLGAGLVGEKRPEGAG